MNFVHFFVCLFPLGQNEIETECHFVIWWDEGGRLNEKWKWMHKKRSSRAMPCDILNGNCMKRRKIFAINTLKSSIEWLTSCVEHRNNDSHNNNVVLHFGLFCVCSPFFLNKVLWVRLPLHKMPQSATIFYLSCPSSSLHCLPSIKSLQWPLSDSTMHKNVLIQLCTSASYHISITHEHYDLIATIYFLYI